MKQRNVSGIRKKALRIIGWLMILCLAGPVTAEGYTQEEWYQMGMMSLKEMSPDSIQEAADSFQAAGNYELARSYSLYAMSVRDIFAMGNGRDENVDPDTILLRLQTIAGNEAFNVSLAENHLPSCEQLTTYLQACRYELSEDYYTARKTYALVSDVFDALNKQIDLIPKIYSQAEKLAAQGANQEAAEIFRELSRIGWKDSGERYQQILSNHEHRWREATCTEPKTCAVFGETEGEPLGHDWQDATCTAPRTCRRCGASEGEALGHDWQEDKCQRCGIPEVTGPMTFSGNFRYVPLWDGTVRIIDYEDKEATEINIPAVLDGKKVSGIGDEAFRSCESLTAVTIPDSVTSIGNEAFASCGSLTGIVIPDGVTRIGESVFKWCHSLKEITVSGDHPCLAVIDGVLFSKPDSRLVYYPAGKTADSYSIPEGTRVIGNYALYGCSSLKSVTIPDSVTRIGSWAFGRCSSLTSVTIPEGVSDIGTNPFGICGNLAEIRVQSPYLAVRNGMLISLPDQRLVCIPCAYPDKNIVIPDGVRTIGNDAFWFCPNPVSVTIPDSVTSISNYSFGYCDSLTGITIPDSVTEIGSFAFFQCQKLEDITIPKSVTRIGWNMVNSCPATVWVEAGSYAETYCVENKIPYGYR